MEKKRKARRKSKNVTAQGSFQAWLLVTLTPSQKGQLRVLAQQVRHALRRS